MRKRADAAVISGVYHIRELRGCVSSPRSADGGVKSWISRLAFSLYFLLYLFVGQFFYFTFIFIPLFNHSRNVFLLFLSWTFRTKKIKLCNINQSILICQVEVVK